MNFIHRSETDYHDFNFLTWLADLFDFDKDRNLKLDQNLKLDENSFTMIKDDLVPMINDTDELKWITSLINQDILTTISKRQQILYNCQNLNLECCVCLEAGMKLVPLKCEHQLCSICYDYMIEHSKFNCPLCRSMMKLISDYKLYAIMVSFDQQEKSYLGIIYQPPIYVEDDDRWIEYNLLEYKNRNFPKQIINIWNRLVKEKYRVVYASDATSKIFESLTGKDIDKKIIIVIN